MRRLALRRGADLDPEAYSVYAEDLMRFQMDDIEAAFKAIGLEPRKAFEKPMPEIGILVEECTRQEKLRRGATSPIRACGSDACSKGMVRVFDASGYPTGVKACPACGGPTWFQEALDSNKHLLRENGLTK